MKEPHRYKEVQLEAGKSDGGQRLKDAIEIARQFTTKEETILDVGCSSEYSLENWTSLGYKVTGYDLRSDIRGAIQGDMHDMHEQYGKWDMVFSSHTLEHAYDYKKVLEEFKQVARHKVFIVVPIEDQAAFAATEKHFCRVFPWEVIKRFEGWTVWFKFRVTGGKELMLFAHK